MLSYISYISYIIHIVSLLTQMICLSVKSCLIWHTGLFDYCTCGHYGWDGIVCLSVGSITWSIWCIISVIPLVSLFESALSDWYLSFESHLLICQICQFWYMQLFHLDVCLFSSDNWVSFSTKLNCQIESTSYYTILIKPLFFD